MKHNGYFSNVGNTPLIKISKQLYAKLETYNPTGSIKDRMIAYVVKRAQERGEFGDDTTFIEATSGNTGIALAAAKMPKKNGDKKRMVVITQGALSTIVATPDGVEEFPVPSGVKVVDTNGAGDAFVGGFLSRLSMGADLATCVSAGNYAARQIIQVSGCKIPSYPAAP